MNQFHDLDNYDTDLAEDLRLELAASDLPLLDPNALVAAGGRQLRRQRMVRGISATAAVAALAIGGYAAWGGIAPNARQVLPGASSSVAPSVSAPAVTGTFSAVVGNQDGAPFTNGPTVFPGAGGYRFDLKMQSPATSSARVTAIGADGIETEVGEFPVSERAERPQVFSSEKSPTVVFALLPASAKAYAISADLGEGGEAITAEAVVGGSGWKAVAYLARRNILPGSVTWQDAAGTFRDAEGKVLPVVDLGDGRTLWLDTSGLATAGVFDGAGSTYTKPLALGTPGFTVLQLGSDDKPSLLAVVLPTNASDPRAILPKDIRLVGEPRISPLDRENSVAWLTYQGPTTEMGSVALTWLNERGALVSSKATTNGMQMAETVPGLSVPILIDSDDARPTLNIGFGKDMTVSGSTPPALTLPWSGVRGDGVARSLVPVETPEHRVTVAVLPDKPAKLTITAGGEVVTAEQLAVLDKRTGTRVIAVATDAAFSAPDQIIWTDSLGDRHVVRVEAQN